MNLFEAKVQVRLTTATILPMICWPLGFMYGICTVNRTSMCISYALRSSVRAVSGTVQTGCL